MPIQHIPAQFRPQPYESPFQRQMPQFIMSMLGYYFQNKMASTREKKQIEQQDLLATERMTKQWKQEDFAREDQQQHQVDMAQAKADLGKKKYHADMRKDHIQLKDNESFPKGYEQSDVIMGLGGESWWVKRRERPYKVGQVIKTKVNGKTHVQIIAGYDEEGLPRDIKGDSIKTGVFEEKEKDPDQMTRFLNVKTKIYKSLNKGAEPPPEKMESWMMEWRRSGATRVTIEQRAQEKFGFQKAATAGELRSELATNKDNKISFESNASQYNNLNTQGEVAYWKTGGMWTDEEVKIIKLPQEAIAAGWTPTEVQSRAIGGKTVEQVLKEIGVLE